jgi:hypothetical protein
MLKIELLQTDDAFEAIEDISYVVAKKMNLRQEEVLIKALAAYIGVEKPFTQAEVNSMLQRHILGYIEG